jgi:hypothetical protein
VLEGANDDSNLGGEVIDDGVVFNEEEMGAGFLRFIRCSSVKVLLPCR